MRENRSVICAKAVPCANRASSSESNHRRILTHGGTLGDRLLAATTADTRAVDDIALLGLVPEAASLVGAAGPRGTVDDVQLAELY
jgi:hypothetical protein